MDYSIRRIESPQVRPVAPRRKRDEQTPFDMEALEEGDEPADDEPAEGGRAPDRRNEDRGVAGPEDDEPGARLDLSA